MRQLLLLALVGLGAQLIDGSLGMAYGVTSTTLLLVIGTNPARTLIRSDWIDASDGTRTIVYVVVSSLWAAAVTYSSTEYRKNRQEERRIIAEAEAATHQRQVAAPRG